MDEQFLMSTDWLFLNSVSIILATIAGVLLCQILFFLLLWAFTSQGKKNNARAV
jgi:hypothetical protein